MHTHSCRKASTSGAKKSSPKSSDSLTKFPISSPFLYTNNAGTPFIDYKITKIEHDHPMANIKDLTSKFIDFIINIYFYHARNLHTKLKLSWA